MDNHATGDLALIWSVIEAILGGVKNKAADLSFDLDLLPLLLLDPATVILWSLSILSWLFVLVAIDRYWYQHRGRSSFWAGLMIIFAILSSAFGLFLMIRLDTLNQPYSSFGMVLIASLMAFGAIVVYISYNSLRKSCEKAAARLSPQSTP